MAVKFCLLRSCFVLDASFAKFSQFFIKFDYPSRNKSSIMPPKRKAVAAKEKPVEEAPIESKKTKIVKKVEDAGTNGDAKSKRGRAARGGSSDSEPKPTRGTKKPVEDEDPLEEAEEDEREETPPPVETKKRGRKASAPKPTPVESDEEEKPEKEDTPPPTRKGGRTRKPIAPPEDEDLSDEEEIEKPKPKGRAKKPAASSKAETLANPTETDYEQIDFSCDKENKLGEKPNTIIASWNVDGLRAWLKKDGLKYIEFEKPDVLCIQESKCSSEKLPEEVTELEGYHKYWTESDKEGYAGVGLFSRTKPINVEYGIGVPEHDEEGRCITAEFEKYYVVSVYVPNSGRKLVTLPKRLEWNKAFKTYIKELDKKKPVIIGGDMNVAHDEIDLANPKTNTKNAGFTKEEREGMTALLGDGYIDSYRKFNPDKTGAYTFWTYMMKSRSKNVGWRLDYFLVSERLGDALCDNVIRSEVLGSDHCPIVLFLNV